MELASIRRGHGRINPLAHRFPLSGGAGRRLRAATDRAAYTRQSLHELSTSKLIIPMEEQNTVAEQIDRSLTDLPSVGDGMEVEEIYGCAAVCCMCCLSYSGGGDEGACDKSLS